MTRIQHRIWSRTSRFRLLALLLSFCLLAGNGCRMAQQTVALPGQMVTAVVPGTKSKQPDPAALQAEVLRFADSFGARVSFALDACADRVNTPEGRIKALTWKLALNSSILGIATGPNPTANLLDLVALASMMRDSLEERAPKAQPPGALDPFLDNSRILETNAWNLAESALTADQLRQLRAAIEQWHGSNPTVGEAFFARPQELAMAIRESGEKQGTAGGVFGMSWLDPMSGLDPAVREVTRSRLFAERALFAVQHTPFFLRWQIELLSDQLLRQAQVEDALQSIDRLSRAAETASQTAALLPERISTERKAVLDALDTQEGKLRDLSAQVGQTLSAGEKMSTALNGAIISLDALMKRFGVGEPSTTPPDTNSPPFNILDYARTAEQIAAMAQHLDALIKDTSGTVDTPALDKRIAQLNALSGKARSDAKSVLNHAFLLVAGLIVLVFACAFVYRRLAPRGTTSPVGPGSSGAKS